MVAIRCFYKLLAIHPIDPLQVPNMPKRDAWPVNSAIEYGVVYAIRQQGADKEQTRGQETMPRSIRDAQDRLFCRGGGGKGEVMRGKAG
jgi:hypothetical protein